MRIFLFRDQGAAVRRDFHKCSLPIACDIDDHAHRPHHTLFAVFGYRGVDGAIAPSGGDWAYLLIVAYIKAINSYIEHHKPAETN